MKMEKEISPQAMPTLSRAGDPNEYFPRLWENDPPSSTGSASFLLLMTALQQKPFQGHYKWTQRKENRLLGLALFK